MSGKISNSRPPCGARKPRKIRDGVFYVGAADWDRALFDALIPLPDGTSYNAYLIEGSEKTALIDAVEPRKIEELLDQISGVDRIDYIVSLHAEQDHSGGIPHVLERHPEAKVVANAKAKTMLQDLLTLPEEVFLTVKEGDALSLGGKTLEFIMTPWVHWPETMCAFLPEEGILFSCDMFGAHLASSELYATDRGRVLEAAKRYYAEIMMPFANVIRKNLEKIGRFPIQMIAPSHGPVYADPGLILEAYGEWASGPPKNLVALPYVSMHGSTQQMVDCLLAGLVNRGVRVAPCNMENGDIGKLAMSLVDAGSLVLAAPTVLGGPHPNLFYAAFLAAQLRPKAKFLSVIGSYGWQAKTAETLTGVFASQKMEVLEPVLAKGLPKAAEREALDRLAATIAEKHRENGFA